ncbi:hypothetical protein [Winogradskyella aurantia]|uniref:hypothetical protein n=1 Tax=Winogradskyella aurantia TaxID=1915063 RepID=UPI0013FD53FB|nr:hypothetical protein [Winogradskyella aurantia]
MKNKYVFTFLKILAFVIPFHFVFYGPLHDKVEHPKIKILWKYVCSGVLAYILFFNLFK